AAGGRRQPELREGELERYGAARRPRRRRSRATRAALTPQLAPQLAPQLPLKAGAHELLALVAFELLVARLLVAGLHAVLLLLLRRGRGVRSALQAGAHELLALVAFLVARLGVAVLHALLLLLLRRSRLLLCVLLVLRPGAVGGEDEGNRGDQQSHWLSSSRRSMALTNLASFGATRVPY